LPQAPISASAFTRGLVAGNGGRMAERKQQKSAKKCGTAKNRKKIGASRNASAKRQEAKLQEQLPQSADEPTQEDDLGVDGRTRLLNAIERKVAKNANAIADSLVGQAQKGTISATKQLIDLLSRNHLEPKNHPEPKKERSENRLIAEFEVDAQNDLESDETE